MQPLTSLTHTEIGFINILFLYLSSSSSSPKNLKNLNLFLVPSLYFLKILTLLFPVSVININCIPFPIQDFFVIAISDGYENSPQPGELVSPLTSVLKK